MSFETDDQDDQLAAGAVSGLAQDSLSGDLKRASLVRPNQRPQTAGQTHTLGGSQSNALDSCDGSSDSGRGSSRQHVRNNHTASSIGHESAYASYSSSSVASSIANMSSVSSFSCSLASLARHEPPPPLTISTNIEQQQQQQQPQQQQHTLKRKSKAKKRQSQDHEHQAQHPEESPNGLASSSSPNSSASSSSASSSSSTVTSSPASSAGLAHHSNCAFSSHSSCCSSAASFGPSASAQGSILAFSERSPSSSSRGSCSSSSSSSSGSTSGKVEHLKELLYGGSQAFLSRAANAMPTSTIGRYQSKSIGLISSARGVFEFANGKDQSGGSVEAAEKQPPVDNNNNSACLAAVQQRRRSWLMTGSLSGTGRRGEHELLMPLGRCRRGCLKMATSQEEDEEEVGNVQENEEIEEDERQPSDGTQETETEMSSRDVDNENNNNNNNNKLTPARSTPFSLTSTVDEEDDESATEAHLSAAAVCVRPSSKLSASSELGHLSGRCRRLVAPDDQEPDECLHIKRTSADQPDECQQQHHHHHNYSTNNSSASSHHQRHRQECCPHWFVPPRANTPPPLPSAANTNAFDREQLEDEHNDHNSRERDGIMRAAQVRQTSSGAQTNRITTSKQNNMTNTTTSPEVSGDARPSDKKANDVFVGASLSQIRGAATTKRTPSSSLTSERSPIEVELSGLVSSFQLLAPAAASDRANRTSGQLVLQLELAAAQLERANFIANNNEKRHRARLLIQVQNDKRQRWSEVAEECSADDEGASNWLLAPEARRRRHSASGSSSSSSSDSSANESKLSLSSLSLASSSASTSSLAEQTLSLSHSLEDILSSCRNDDDEAENDLSSTSMRNRRVNRRKHQLARRRARFWRLVASDSNTESSSSPDLERFDKTPERVCAPRPTPSPQSDATPVECPLAGLIRDADQDPSNRPRLLLPERELVTRQLQEDSFALHLQAAAERVSPTSISSDNGATSSDSPASKQQLRVNNLIRLNSIHEQEDDNADDDDALLAARKVIKNSSAGASDKADGIDEFKVEISGAQMEAINSKREQLDQQTRAGQALKSTGGQDGDDDDVDEHEEEAAENSNEDDYFYDDELAFGQQRQRLLAGASRLRGVHQRVDLQQAPVQHVNLKKPECNDHSTTTTNATRNESASEVLLARLSASVRGRPLLVWAPSARRVSCPTGTHLSGFSSWRQLWSAAPPAVLAQFHRPANIESQLLAGGAQQLPCANCLGHRAASCQQQSANENAAAAAAARIHQTHSPTNNDRWPINRTEAIASARNSLANFDYFSSFDQTPASAAANEQSAPQTIGSFQQQQQQGDMWRDVVAFEAAKRLTTQLAAGTQASTASQRRQLRPTTSNGSGVVPTSSGRQAHSQLHCAELVAVPPLELRRQSTITGFDHQRYTAPRSPSLCLPHQRGLGRNSSALIGQPSASGAGCGSSQNTSVFASGSTLGPPSSVYTSAARLLSPTHSTGGSSSPSPTSWQHQNASALANVAQQYYNQTQATARMLNGATGSGVGPAGAGRYPPSQPGVARTQFGRARLESLESDRGSSPSWSASTSSLRSSIGGGSSIYLAQMMAANQARKRSSGSICSTSSGCGMSSTASCANTQIKPSNGQPAHLTPGCSHCATNAGQAAMLQQLREEVLDQKLLTQLTTASGPIGEQHKFATAGQLIARHQQQLQQEQAVYFFLCCCQRNDSRNGDSQQEASGGEQQQPAAEGLEQRGGEQRRVSLVGRPAIVSEPTSGRATTSRAGQNGQQLAGFSGASETRADAPADRKAISDHQAQDDQASGQDQQQQQQRASGALMPQGTSGATAAAAKTDKQADSSKQTVAKDIEQQQTTTTTTATTTTTSDDEAERADFRSNLSALLSQLDRISATGRQLSGAERQLLAVLERRLLSGAGGPEVGASLIVEDTAEGGAGSAAGGAPDHAHLERTGQGLVMRYSTPNLLLSSHFEHILRQQDRRAKQEERTPEADPPEATEAWFLSRSPTAGRASGGSSAGPTGSRESVRRSLDRTTRASGAGAQRALDALTDTSVPTPVGRQQDGAEEQERRRSTASMQTGGQVQPEVSATTSRGSCQLASNEIVRQEAASDVDLDAKVAGASADIKRPTDSAAASSNWISGKLGGTLTETAGQVEAAADQQQQQQSSGQQPAGAQQTVCSSPTSGSQNPTHDKSMAQARYLYSTLTSNTGALLASQVLVQPPAVSSTANSSSTGAELNNNNNNSTSAPQAAGEQKPATAVNGGNKSSPAAASSATKSPVRSVGLQRKRAQFVTVAERQHLEATRAGSSGNVVAHSTALKAAEAPPGEPRSMSSLETKSGARGDPNESSGSDHDGSDDDEQHRRLAAKRLGEHNGADDDAADEQDDDLMEPPEIIESACEQRRRSSQTSRSISMDTANQSLQQQQQQQQQLQPTMDPEMHALWAQGADLDTGNGNFIQATRRRRSVHAIHQVQLHQQQQQQHHQQQHQQMAGSRRLKQQSESGASQLVGIGQQAPVVGLTPSDSRNFKDKLRKLRSSGSIEESHQSRQSAGSSRARFVSDPVTSGQRAGSEIPEQSEREESDSSWSARQSEPLIGRKVDELVDDEEAAAAGAAAVAAASKQLESSDDDDVLSPARRTDSLGRGQKTQEFVKRARLDTEQAECLEEIEFEDDDDGSQLDNKRLYVLTDDAEYDLDELESSSSMLAELYLWNYPIFELSNRYGKTILSKLSYRIFFDSGFFDSFKIPKQAFFSFFHALEEGYHDKPYHNRLHAADVLHAVYYLTSQPIEHFCQVPLDLIELYDNLLATTRPGADFEHGDDEFMSKLHNHVVAIVVAAAAAAADSELPFGLMGANLTALEVMALYTAAAMHDFQHPGRTNSFLVATSSPLALLYNDRSVLENHHSAAAWALFYSGPNLNWLCNLEKDEFKRFRFMIIELILATDLMRHYELVSAFNKKLNNVGRHNIDWFCESDRLLVMEIIIKLADVNGPMKGHQLHCQWTDRIAMEFYEQGDEERALNLPVSLYMDRSDPRLPELQKSFINHLVGPLSHSYAAAGFFPKSNEPKMIDDDDDEQPEDANEPETTPDSSRPRGSSLEANNEQESVYSQTKYWLIEDSTDGRSKLNKQFLDCVQTMNLRNNFLYWDAKSKLKQQHSKQSATSASSSIDQSID